MTNVTAAISNALKHWYLPLLVGIMFILFGAYIFTVPIEAYVTLSVLFSVAFFFSGVSEIVFAFTNKEALQGWGWYLVSGIITFLIGTYLVMDPAISMATLPFLVAFGMMFRSAHSLGVSLDLKKLGLNWGNLAFSSVLGILISFFLLANPVFAQLSIVTMTALSIIIVGVCGVTLAMILKNMKDMPARK
ncbi:MAG TPA: DUF308 domain-containing protein [Cyclobacteriaceae bacterium]|nr:DUF308 domain-containing protein [Cyclobacteriaceae bacterium]